MSNFIHFLITITCFRFFWNIKIFLFYIRYSWRPFQFSYITRSFIINKIGAISQWDIFTLNGPKFDLLFVRIHTFLVNSLHIIKLSIYKAFVTINNPSSTLLLFMESVLSLSVSKQDINILGNISVNS